MKFNFFKPNIFQLLFLLTLTGLFCTTKAISWPWSSNDSNTPSAEDILKKIENDKQNEEEDGSSFLERIQDITQNDAKESKNQAAYFDKFRFFEKNKQEKKTQVMKAKLLGALDVNIDQIARKRTFMNEQVDRDPQFEHSLKAIEQLKYLLLPIRRFQELDNQKSSEEYIDYYSTYTRRISTLLGRMYAKQDDIKLQVAIVETNLEFFGSPKFRFGEFYIGYDSRTTFEVLRAKNYSNLEDYWKELDLMRDDFVVKLKEMKELRKQTDANMYLLYDSLDEIQKQINTQEDMFFDIFSNQEGDAENRKKDKILEFMKEQFRDLIMRRERILDSVGQIQFILRELMEMKEPLEKFYKKVKPKVEMVLVTLRTPEQSNRNIHAEEYFRKKEIEEQERMYRNKVVSEIEDKNIKVEDIQDPEIGQMVLTTQDQDPKSDEDPYLHLRDKKTIEKTLDQQKKDAEDREKNMKGNTPEESDEVTNIYSPVTNR
jgi:hypothetical protein